VVVFRAPDSEGVNNIAIGAGFFENDWSMERAEFVWETD
jgi:hypothetical protein